ncbi:flagellar protein FlaG [Thermovibrio ammonificans]
MDVKPIASTKPAIDVNLQNINRLEQQQLQQTVNKKGEEGKVTPEQLQEALKDLKDKLSILNTQLEIKIDKDTDIIVVKVIDKTTHKVIRQIPPEYVLKIAKYLNEIAGLLYNEKV